MFALFSQHFFNKVCRHIFFGIFHLFHIFSVSVPFFHAIFCFFVLRLREQLSVMVATATPVLAVFFPLPPAHKMLSNVVALPFGVLANGCSCGGWYVLFGPRIFASYGRFLLAAPYLHGSNCTQHTHTYNHTHARTCTREQKNRHHKKKKEASSLKTSTLLNKRIHIHGRNAAI